MVHTGIDIGACWYCVYGIHCYVKEGIISKVRNPKTLADIVIYIFNQFMQIAITRLIHNTNACEHYRGSKHLPKPACDFVYGPNLLRNTTIVHTTLACTIYHGACEHG